MQHPSEAPLESMAFHVEQWSSDGLRVETILAASINIRMARAAYEVALTERPTAIVKLRHRARIVEERIPI